MAKENKKTSLKKEDLTIEALNTKLIELKKEAMNQRFQKVSNGLPKTDVIRKTRREIARVKTAITKCKKEEK